MSLLFPLFYITLSFIYFRDFVFAFFIRCELRIGSKTLLDSCFWEFNCLMLGLFGVGLFVTLLWFGEVIFFFYIFYYLFINLELRYRLLFELLRLFTFFKDDFYCSIFYLNASAKLDFLKTPIVELGIVDFVKANAYVLP